jgi:hypothetical protein
MAQETGKLKEQEYVSPRGMEPDVSSYPFEFTWALMDHLAPDSEAS